MPPPGPLYLQQPGLLRRLQSGNPIFWGLQIGPQTLIIGTPFSLALAPSVFGSPVGALIFALVSGTLPAGLSLNASTGLVSGTPTAAGSTSLVFSATDGSATATSAAIAVTVLASAPVTQYSEDQSLPFFLGRGSRDEWWYSLGGEIRSGTPDSLAPSITTGLVVTGTAPNYTLSWDAPCDPADPLSPASGLLDAGVYRDASLLTRLTYSGPGISLQLVGQDVGAVHVAGTSTQGADGTDWTLVAEGLSIDQPPDSFHFAQAAYSGGSIVLTTHVQSFAQAAGGVGGGALKYNPGHYAASAYFQGNGLSNLSAIFAEIDLMAAVVDSNGNPRFKGYELQLPWGQMEDTQGHLNTSQVSMIDQVITRLSTNYSYNGVTVPFRLVLTVFGESGSSSPNTDFPAYLVNGISGQGSDVVPIGGSWAAAYYRPAVMSAWINVWALLGARYDGNPYVEVANAMDETAIDYTGSDPGFSLSAWVTQLQALGTALKTSWPTTIKAIRPNFITGGSQSDVNSFTAFLYANGLATGGPDVITAASGIGETWSELAYYNGSGGGGTDYRGLMPAIFDVESDVWTWLNQTSAGDEAYCFGTLKPTHVLWSIYPAPYIAGNSSQWWQTGTVPALQAVNFRVAATALSCPTNFGGLCNASAASGSPNAKTGLMVRQSLLANDIYVAAFVYPTPTDLGVALEYRTTAGAFRTQVGLIPGLAAPIWLRLVRQVSTPPDNWTVEYSSDSNVWHQVGTAQMTLTGTVRVGIAAASYQAGVTVTATHKNFCAQNLASLTYNDSAVPAGSHTYTITGRDRALNEAAAGAAVTVASGSTITYVAAGTFADATGGLGPLTPGLPAVITSGDLLLAIVNADYSAGSSPKILTPSGYNLIDGHNSIDIAIFNKMAGASETAPGIMFSDSTATFNDELALMFAFRGTKSIASISDLDNLAYNEYGPLADSTSGLPFPALTVNSAGCAVVLFVGTGGNVPATTAPDVSWTKIGDFQITDPNSQFSMFALYYKIQTTAANIAAGVVAAPSSLTNYYSTAWVFSIPHA